MANRDVFESVIYVNNEQAKDAIAEMTAKMQRLNAQYDKIVQSNGELDKEAVKTKKKIDSLKKSIDGVQVGVDNYKKAMDSLSSRSIDNLVKLKRQLNSEIRKLTPGTKEYIDMTSNYQKVVQRLNSLEKGYKMVNEEVKTSSLSLKGLADGFNKYFGMVTAGIAAITGVSMAFRKTAEEAAKLDDTYSDVMKTTGLMHDEVEALDKQLMELDTRTSREQLLLLARDAGKLGITGSENILGFVRAADQIQVALGEDLGEGAIRNLGKIADVLGYTKTMGIEQSLLSIGSAVNAVGQASTANEAYLVDFTQRLAGVAAQAGISGANIIGFASGLDQSAMKVEMAATAFQKFLMSLYEDPAKMASYAKMEVEEFTNLLNNDANAAVITILRNLKDQDGFAALVPMFKDMGLDGARAVSVLAAMASNLDAITDAQALANVEFEKATSLSNEFTTKNNNMQASLDKARKEFKNASIALGQSLNPILLKSTNATTYLIKALASYGKEIKAVVITIAALTLAVKANAIAEGIKTAALKVGNAVSKTGIVTSNALRLGYFKLTGQTLQAAAAQKAMNAAMSTSVFGVVAIAAGALAAAIAHLAKKNKEATQSTKELTENEKFEFELAETIASAKSEEAGKIEALSKIIHNENVAYGERLKALNELKAIVPDYHASLTNEGTLINDNITAVENYVEALKKEAIIKKVVDEFGDVESEIIKVKSEIDSLKEKLPEGGIDIFGTDENGYPMAKTNSELAKINAQIIDLQRNLFSLEKKRDVINKAVETASQASLGNTGSSASGNSGGGAGGNSSSKYSDAVKALEAEQRAEENIIMQKYADGKLFESEYNAEMLRIKTEYLQKKLELAEQEKEDTTQIQRQIIQLQLDANKAAAKAADEIAKEAEAKLKAENDKIQEEQKRLEGLAKDFLKSIQDPSEALQIELQQLEEVHQAKLLSEEEYLKAKKALEEKYGEDGLSKAKDWIEKSNQLIGQASSFINSVKSAETAHAEAEYHAQLTAAGNNAEQREQIEARYEQRKLDIQKKYADADMVINIAKAVAAGALAAVEAFAAAGGNPILGGVFAAIIAATTAAEVATIIAQRNAIKSQTVSMPTSSAAGDFSTETSGGNIGSRVVTGYARGGYTEDHTTLTTVGERGTEWIAPHWMVKQNPITFANLESYRRAGSHGRSGSVARGFADGGYTPGAEGGENGFSAQLAAMLSANTDASNRLASLIEKGLHAYVVLSELNQAQDKQNRFNEKTSR